MYQVIGLVPGKYSNLLYSGLWSKQPNVEVKITNLLGKTIGYIRKYMKRIRILQQRMNTNDANFLLKELFQCLNILGVQLRRLDPTQHNQPSHKLANIELLEVKHLIWVWWMSPNFGSQLNLIWFNIFLVLTILLELID